MPLPTIKACVLINAMILLIEGHKTFNCVVKKACLKNKAFNKNMPKPELNKAIKIN